MALTFNTLRYGNIFIIANTFDDLRTLSPRKLLDGYIAITSGKIAQADPLGQLFVWNRTSTIPDDNSSVIAPNAASVDRCVLTGRDQFSIDLTNGLDIAWTTTLTFSRIILDTAP